MANVAKNLFFARVEKANFSQKERIINFFTYWTQLISWPVIYIFLNLFFKININGRENLHLTKDQFIIAANHFSFFDSFLFRIMVSGANFNLPLRFMAVRRFNSVFLNIAYKTGIIPLIYLLFGVFTVIPGVGLEKNLQKAIRILDSGGNIVIYPEGKINNKGGLVEFKKGVIVLAKETGYPILPVTFSVVKDTFRRKIKITIGEPHYVSRLIPVNIATKLLYEGMLFQYNEGFK